MTSFIKKIIVLLAIVSFFVALMLAVGNVRAENETPTPTPKQDCASCHPESYKGWHVGGHGDVQAGVVKQQEMNCSGCHKDFPLVGGNQLPGSGEGQSDGKPPLCLSCHATGYNPDTGEYKSEGISCEACHGEMPEKHPADNMPVNKSAELCSTCHTDSRFNWSSWANSVHYQKNMECSTCHDPHTTKLKIVDPNASDASELCMGCHEEQTKNSHQSVHAMSNVTCVACHLGPTKGQDDFHQVPDHSFKPVLETCNACHADQMHEVGEALSPTETAQPEAAINKPLSIVTTASQEEPATSSSFPASGNMLGFVGMAGFIGILGGVIIHKNRKHK